MFFNLSLNDLKSFWFQKEIEHKVLRAQHYKLCERFRYKQKIQQELEKRIEEFERRQVQDDAVNCIINRYWNRVCGIFLNF